MYSDIFSVSEVKASPAHSTVALIEDEPEDSDPWDLPELKDTGVPWSGEDLYCSHITCKSTILSYPSISKGVLVSYAVSR